MLQPYDSRQSSLALDFFEQKIARQHFPLRDYQRRATEAYFEAICRQRRVLVQLPTGAGKTIFFCTIAREFLKDGMGVAILAHRRELIDQAHEKIEAISGLPAARIQAGKAFQGDADIYVASVQTLSRRKYRPEGVGLIVVDEAHHAASRSYDRILKAYPNAYILGVSATPTRADGQGLRRQFDLLIDAESVGASVKQLIANNYLSPYKLFASQTQVATHSVRKSAGDYNLGDLSEAVDSSIAAGDLLEAWQQFAGGSQTIAFHVDVRHSLEACEAYNEAGIRSAHIDGKTPKVERESLIQAFKDKEIVVLHNCGIFTEGFDVPGIETIQIVRPTTSLTLWLQMIGRGLRPSPGKEFCRIIDHTQNWQFLGLPDDDREWTLDPVSLKNPKWAQECSECHHIFRPLSHELKEPVRALMQEDGSIVNLYQCTCPNCNSGFEFEMGKGGIGGSRLLTKDESAKLREVAIEVQDWAISIFDELEAIQKSTRKRKGWIYYRLLEHERVGDFSLGSWKAFAQRLGYKPGWGYYKYLEAQEAAKPKATPRTHQSFHPTRAMNSNNVIPLPPLSREWE